METARNPSSDGIDRLEVLASKASLAGTAFSLTV